MGEMAFESKNIFFIAPLVKNAYEAHEIIYKSRGIALRSQFCKLLKTEKAWRDKK